LGATGTFLASDGGDASTGQVICVDCACQIIGMRGGKASPAHARPSWVSNAALAGRQAMRPDSRLPAPAIHGDATQQSVGHGHHVHSDVAVCGDN
jgi:hypothetical protein